MIPERRHPYDHPADIAAEREFYEATNADRRSTSVQQNGRYGEQDGLVEGKQKATGLGEGP